MAKGKVTACDGYLSDIVDNVLLRGRRCRKPALDWPRSSRSRRKRENVVAAVELEESEGVGPRSLELRHLIKVSFLMDNP